MRWVRWRGRALWVALLVGFAVGSAVLTPADIVFLLLLFGVAGGLLGAAWLFDRPLSDAVRVRKVVRLALQSAAASIALFGPWMLAPVPTLLVVAAIAATSPMVLRLVSGARRREEETLERASAASDLTDTQLCHAWQASYISLEWSTDTGHSSTVVALRARLLDELATRHPRGFAEWMASGPCAASDPIRYFVAE